MEQQALLQAVRANTEDRAARLVYADWLDEHGELLLAEYVRAECEVMAADPGSESWRGAMDRRLAVVRKAKANLGGWEYPEEVARLRALSDPGEDEDEGEEDTYGRLQPVVREANLITFEKRHGVTLPGEYRAFLLRVGNGWSDGAESGIIRFDPKETHEPLATPFAPTRADALEMLSELQHTFTSADDNPPEPARRRDYAFNGCLTVVESGCGNSMLLVVRGERRGHLWSFGDINGPGADNDFTRLLGFFEWFEPVLEEPPW